MSKSILDPTFRYVNAASTNIAETFKRVRRKQQREQEQAKADAAEAQKKVQQIGRTK